LLINNTNTDIRWYSDNIPIRGCRLDLPKIKAAYEELSKLTVKEGERIVNSRNRPKRMRKQAFQDENKFLLDDAFRLTVSIIGFDGQTSYGESEEIFERKNLPSRIKTIYFTNETAYRRNANNELPANRFSLSLHFDKPPLFDPDPVLSEPTINSSSVNLKADDVGYFRAVQTIVNEKLNIHKTWYSLIHAKFAYDVGMWLFAIPVALYWLTIYNEYLFTNGNQASFNVAFFIYGAGLSLILYRTLFSYLKWAFPVNILEENKDRATRHRIILGTIIAGLFYSSIESVIKTITGF